MFAAVIFVHQQQSRRIIPIDWIYKKKEIISSKKHYMSYFNFDNEKKAPPIDVLCYNTSCELQNNEIHKVYVHKILGE